jgi:galectin-8
VSIQVAVNGKHTLLYAHRISPEKIDTLGIYGTVNIHSVGFSFSSVSTLPQPHSLLGQKDVTVSRIED